MIYPGNFEHKIGFDEIRTRLKGRCLSSLGTGWVDNQLSFKTNYQEIVQAQNEARDFARFMSEGDDDVECEFFDVRETLLHARPERTWLEEPALFDLKRSIKAISDFVDVFKKGDKEDDVPLSSPQASDEGEEDTVSSCEHVNYKYPALAAMASDVVTFAPIIEKIDAVLNKYGKVKDTASTTLLTVRHQIEVTTRGISHSLRTIINEAQTAGYIDRDVAPTLRDGRLVIPVPPAMKRKVRGIIHDESATGKTVFIEPAVIVDANNKIRELKAEERREVMRILQELTAFIRPYISDIIASLQFLAHVDYLRALTILSETFEAIIPETRSCPAICWEQARHPLLERTLKRHDSKIIPLDVVLHGDQHILLISGPNAGGKSVCLKTVALIQYMLQCGMPVPVSESSKPGIFDDLFIDIGDEQSIEDDLSTYSSHLLNMKKMMKHAGNRSLLLIDEFGGGTEPQIGGALAEAMLNRFVAQSAWGVITTHYQNLKHYASQQNGVVNGAMLYDRAQMRPLYLLQIGNPGSSFAIEIARKIGVPEDVISYAENLVGKDYVLSDKYLQDIVRDKVYWERKRTQVKQREKKLEEAISGYERELSDFQQRKQGILADAKVQAQQLLDASNAKVENTIRAIREAQAEKERTREVRAELKEYKQSLEQSNGEEDRIARKIAKLQRRRQRKAEQGGNGRQQREALEAAVATKLRQGQKLPNLTVTQGRGVGQWYPGMYVRVKGQSSVGKIVSVSGQSAKVLFGMMYMQMDLAKLELAENPIEDQKVQAASTFVSRSTRDAMSNKKLHFKPEIDIRGMHADEALVAVRNFIDDAILCEQSRVRILHGTGTGALRQLVREYLATEPGVSSFRDEHVQFGGAGVTVVELH